MTLNAVVLVGITSSATKMTVVDSSFTGFDFTAGKLSCKFAVICVGVGMQTVEICAVGRITVAMTPLTSCDELVFKQVVWGLSLVRVCTLV